MSTSKNIFFGQHENEHLMFWIRKHWIVLLPTITVLFTLGLFIFFIAYQFLIGTFSDGDEGLYHAILLGVTTIGIIFIHALFLKIFSYLFDFVIITDCRIIEIQKTAFFFDERETIDLPKVQDIKAEKNGFFPCMMRYGNVELTLSNIEFSKKLQYVPHPSHAQERITQIKRRHIFKQERDEKELTLIPLPGE